MKNKCSQKKGWIIALSSSFRSGLFKNLFSLRRNLSLELVLLHHEMSLISLTKIHQERNLPKEL